MKTIFVTLIALLALSNVTHAQPSEKEREEMLLMMEKMMYQAGQSLFADKPLYYDKDSISHLPWKNPEAFSQTEILRMLDTVAAQAVLSLEEGTLQFNSRFPEGVSYNSDLFGLDFVNVQLHNGEGEPLRIGEQKSMYFGSENQSIFRDGVNKHYYYRTINAEYTLEGSLTASPAGSLEAVASMIDENGYEVVHIQPKDVGNTITLGSRSFEILDIKNNQVILLPDAALSDEDKNFEILNLDKAEQFAYDQVSMYKLQERKEAGEDIDFSQISGVGYTSFPKSIYEIFQKDPSIAFEDFQDLVHDDLLKALEAKESGQALQDGFGPKVLVIDAVGPIENLYLYRPSLRHKKKFSLSLAENE